MPRTYKRKLGARRYSDYNPNILAVAINSVKQGKSVKSVAEEFGISRRTLGNKVKQLHSKSPGGQASLMMKRK